MKTWLQYTQEYVSPVLLVSSTSSSFHLDLLLFLDLGKSTEKNLLMIRWNLIGPSQEAVSNKLELFELPSSVLKVFWFTPPENSKLKVPNCKEEKVPTWLIPPAAAAWSSGFVLLRFCHRAPGDGGERGVAEEPVRVEGGQVRPEERWRCVEIRAVGQQGNPSTCDRLHNDRFCRGRCTWCGGWGARRT